MSEPQAVNAMVARGLLWNTLAQVFSVLVSLGAMLVLVRVIPAEEYGRAASVAGALSLLNAFGCAVFLSHSLQLPDGEEPDWSLHLSVAVRLQAVAFVVCHALGALARLSPTYRSLAPLLHLSAFGLLLEAPAQLGFARMRRQMAFRRMRIVLGIGTLLTTATTLTFGLLGYGATAIVLGANLIGTLPMTIDLFFVEGWRPRPGWLGAYSHAAYAESWRFGAQRGALGLLFTLRGAAPSSVLPASIGFAALGVLGRAQSMLALSGGRVLGVALETIYPLLPRAASDREAYLGVARLLVTLLSFTILPLCVFVGIHGSLVVEVAYGGRWAAVGPLLPATALAFLGQATLAFASTILLGQNRLRACFITDVTAGVAITLALVAAPMGGLLWYAWAVTGATWLAAGVAIAMVRREIGLQALVAELPPTLVASSAAALATIAVARSFHARPVPQLVLVSLTFAIVAIAMLRFGFPARLRELLRHVPRGAWVTRALRLEPR